MAEGIIEMAWQQFRLGRTSDAETRCVDVLTHRGDDPAALFLLASIWEQRGQYTEAVGLLRRAIARAPLVAEYHLNLGAILGRLGNFDDSVAALREAIRLRPDYASAYGNLGISFIRTGRVDDALSNFRQALDLRPDEPQEHVNLGRALLLTGELSEGFAEYQWRLQRDPAQYPMPSHGIWDGAIAPGRTVLLRAEQGFGDTIQFARYIPLLVERGNRVVFECQPQLHRLIACLNGPSVKVVVGGSSQADVDAEAWLLSLPHLLDTTLQSIPATVPYLRAETVLIDQWRAELPTAGEVVKVGIAWQGNQTFNSDRDRSIPLTHFEPLARLPNVQLINLQKGFGAEQLDAFAARDRILNLAPRLDQGPGRAFCDTAAVLGYLDLLITSDTAIAHLAGALGVPVWVALAYQPDWRWMLDRQDSPWYPTMRLFRQSRPGDWGEVFQRITDAVASVAADGRPGRTCLTSVLIAPGELADRMTILRIKCGRLGADAAGAAGLQDQFSALEKEWDQKTPANQPLLETLVSALDRVNQDLWDVEDELRARESKKHFDDGFVELSRSVYRLNDHRSRLKFRIDRLLGSTQIETKVYAQSSRPHFSTQVDSLSEKIKSSLTEDFNAAVHALEAGRYAEADANCRRIVKCDPSHARATHLIGLVAHNTGDQTKAIEWMRRSIDFDPSIPAFHNNLGEAMRLSDLLVDALASYQAAIRLKPDFAEAHFNMGIAHRYLGDFHAALACNRRAVALSPDDPEIHLNLSITQFLTDDWAAGFVEYEWRWRAASFGSPRRNFSQPRWAGQDLAAKTILVHAEQGFGDTIQFCRYAPLLRQRGAAVTMEVQPELKKLLAQSLDARVIARGEELGPFNYCSPMLSLPRIFGTRLDSVPIREPYLLADADKVKQFATRLDVDGRREFRVGLVWAGRPTHKNDKNRSIVLETFRPLANIQGIRLISLQQGEATQQLLSWSSSVGGPRLPIEEYGRFADFTETAGLLANLDLLISVDTAVAHLAAALGRPVWLLNPFVCDWRWPPDRDATPWYPTMRIFRQHRTGNWAETIERVAKELHRRLSAESKASPAGNWTNSG
jgi:tetratricopeptide (TPR) repeat protein